MTTRNDVVIGAGPVGRALALRLADLGQDVKVLTRSGKGPTHRQVQNIACDATDADALIKTTAGSNAIYNCANPATYQSWERDWPPLAAGVLKAAESTGAVLVTFGNLYGYGPVVGSMTRNMPLKPADHKGAIRARIWEDALAAHEAGRARVTEARASDYIGPTATAATCLIARYAAATLAGKPAQVFGDPDQPHSWTVVDDIAATLVTLGRDERAWGSPWLVPTNPPVTVRELLRQLNRSVGLGEPKVTRVPSWAINMGGTFVPVLRELNGLMYQFDRPFVVDSSETTEVFGLEPSPWEDVIAQAAKSWATRVG